MRNSRRAVLKGAGGVALGLPWLELTAKNAQAGTMSPKRFVLVSVGHSVDVLKAGGESWLPTGAFAQLSPILQPLVPLQDKLLLLQGVDNLLNDSGIVDSNGHNYSSRSLLTCMPSKPSLDASGNLKPPPPVTCDIPTPAGGPSIEYFLGNAWKEDVLNLRVGIQPGEHSRSYRMDGTLDTGNPSPVDAFSKLFASVMPGTPSQMDKLRAKRKSILDAVQDNFNRVIMRAGMADKVRLQSHANHIREFEATLDKVVKIVCTNPKLNPPIALPSDFEVGEGPHDDAIAGAQIDLITTAFACQASRIAHIHFSSKEDNTFPWLNNGTPLITDGWHGTVHIDRGTDNQRLIPMQWYMKVFGDLLNRLAGTPEGDGTLLDNTMVVWISSLRGSDHNTMNLPVVVAGTMLGKIRSGRLIKYKNRTLGDLWTTVLNLLDVPSTSFGWNKGMGENRPWNSGPFTDWA